MFNPFKKDRPDGEQEAKLAADAAAGGAAPGGNDGEQASINFGEGDIPGEAEQLMARIAQLESELVQAQGERQRALADYANFQRRSVQNERDAKEAGVRGVLHSVLPVIDHFEMALGQNPEQATTRSVLDGVAMIKDELLRALSVHGISVIRPARGDAFDPVRHKAIAQLPAEGVAPGAVSILTRAGFAIGDRMVRPAEVVVTPGETETGGG